MRTRASKPQPVPPTRPISADVATYRHLLRLNRPEAAPLRAKIKWRLHTEPVTELDVESIWAFQSPEWINAILCNIVKFNVLNSQPAGGYIHLFIETEMLNYQDKAARWLVDVYEGHKRSFRGAVDGRRYRGSWGNDKFRYLKGMRWV